MNAQDRDKAQQQTAGAAGKNEAGGNQTQESRQSGNQPGSGSRKGAAEPSETKGGVGSSQGEGQGAGEQAAIFGEGTADIKRESVKTPDVERAGAHSQDSMVNDPTGAFKERP